MDALDPTSIDPAATLSQDDPLRGWLDQFKGDPSLGFKFITDPQGAVDHLVERGIPPPPTSALGYDDPSGSPDPFPQPPSIPLPASKPPGAGSGMPVVRQNPDGSINGNVSDDGAFPPPPTKVVVHPALTPVPLPSPRVDEEATAAGGTARGAPTDLSGKKKGDLSGGLDDFTKSLAGLKAMAPPPLNPVGTPSVRSPGQINTPNLSALLQLFGQQSRPDPVSTLGRLLVAGKA
jgi:hypothetical protein